VIQFSNAFINSLFDLQRIMHLYRNVHVICVIAHPELAAKLKVITLKMKEIFYSDRSDKEIRCCMLLMEFMLLLDEYRKELAPELNDEETYGYTDDVMRRMMQVSDYIKNNLTADDLSQAAMAEMAGISRDYFSRIFKNVTGMNYSKWLNMIRMEKASELLAQEGRTLTEIAMLSGFQSIPSFNRVFREEKGMAPGEYRALFAGEDRKKSKNGTVNK
jgi:AraC-like DNA-binding protein